MRRLQMLGILIFAISCGSDEDKKTEASLPSGTYLISQEVGDGLVAKLVNEKAVLKFPDDATGRKYVVMPFHIGNLATINGAGTEKSAFSFKEGATASSGASLTSPSSNLHKMSKEQLESEAKFLLKAIYNRFQPQKGEKGQGQEFWDLVKLYDQIQLALQQNGYFIHQPRRQLLKEQLLKQISSWPQISLLDTTYASLNGCITESDEIELPFDEGEVNTTAVAAVTSGDGYCIVYESNPEADTKENIDNSVKNLMSAYKTKIYQDTFAAKGDFVFKPYIVIADLSGLAGIEKLAGLYYAPTSDKHKLPILYIAHSFNETNGLSGKDKKVLHATIAHELQHGIMRYYKGGSDVLFVDEGIAHFMEDLLGFRDAGNFADYTFGFLQVWFTNTFPFFGSGSYPLVTESAGQAANSHFRAAGNSLMYYLTSQKGGVSFASGLPSGGAGLSYITSVVKSSAKGLKNVSDLYNSGGENWLTTIGNYLGALMLDNSNLAGVNAKFSVNAKQTVVTDSLGETGKVFGFRFNNADGIEKTYESALLTNLDASSALELEHYATKPGLFEVSATKKELTISSTAEQAAVTIVRIK